MNRISIIGGSGTGKTVLSDNLHYELKLPVYHLDGINYLPDWIENDRDKRDKKFLDIAKKKKWIIDGTYQDTLNERLKKSDLIIYLDYSSRSQIINVIKRYMKYRGKERPEIPGCNDRLSLEFLIWVMKWRKNKRKMILNELSEFDSDKVLIFNNRRSLNKWFYQKFNKKMVI